MPVPQHQNLDCNNMELDEGFDEHMEGMYYDCPCCKRTDIYVGDLMFCERCGSVFCINCDMAESMRFAHPNWPCPLCPLLNVFDFDD